MKELNDLISTIEHYSNEVVGQLDQAKKDLEILKEENERLRSENDHLKRQKTENELLVSARQIVSGIEIRNSDSARKKLNELLREIDKCILLLDD